MTPHRSTRASARARAPLALAAVAALVACNPHVDGNGVFREETRNVGEFTGIDVRNGIRATVTVGGTRRVQVSGDENVVDKVETDVVTDTETGLATLRVRILESYTTFHPLRVTITSPALALIRASGHSDDAETSVDASAVQAASLRVSVADRAHVTIEGAGLGDGSSLLATVSDHSAETIAAELDAHLYPVGDADVTLANGARALVQASASVSGLAPAGTSVVNTGAGVCLVQDGLGNALTCQP